MLGALVRRRLWEKQALPHAYAIASRFRTQALQQQHACEMAFAWQCSFALGAAAVTSGTQVLGLCSGKYGRIFAASGAFACAVHMRPWGWSATIHVR